MPKLSEKWSNHVKEEVKDFETITRWKKNHGSKENMKYLINATYFNEPNPIIQKRNAHTIGYI